MLIVRMAELYGTCWYYTMLTDKCAIVETVILMRVKEGLIVYAIPAEHMVQWILPIFGT